MQIHHVAIGVGDMEKALSFYRDLLGMEVVFDIEAQGPVMDVIQALEGAKARIVMLRLGEQNLELFQYRLPPPKPMPVGLRMSDRGLTHFALQVPNVDELYRKWKAKGVRFYSEPQQLGPTRVVYLYDPEGVTVELIQPG
jgi:glyoxylase I family protein